MFSNFDSYYEWVCLIDSNLSFYTFLQILRVILLTQNMPSHLDQLKAGRATKNVQNQAAGVKSDRPGPDKLMTNVRRGDTVVVSSLGRIALNTRHLLRVIESFVAAGVTLAIARDKQEGWP